MDEVGDGSGDAWCGGGSSIDNDDTTWWSSSIDDDTGNVNDGTGDAIGNPDAASGDDDNEVTRVTDESCVARGERVPRGGADNGSDDVILLLIDDGRDRAVRGRPVDDIDDVWPWWYELDDVVDDACVGVIDGAVGMDDNGNIGAPNNV